VVHGEVATLGEREPEQRGGGEEDARLQHAVELEVRLELRLVEVVLGPAHLLGVVLPVPRREREATRVLVDQRLHPCRFGARLRGGRGDEAGEQRRGGRRGLRHLVVEAVGGVAREAEQPRPFGAQHRQAADQVAGVVRATLLRAARRGEEEPLPERPVGERGLRRLLRGVLQREHPLVGEPAPCGHLGRGGDLPLAQPGELRGVVHDHGASGRRGEQPAPELGGERRLLLVELLEPRLALRRQPGSSAHEVAVVALDEHPLLGREVERVALRVHGLHPRVEPVVHVDRVVVRGQPRRLLGLDLLQRGVGVRRRERVERLGRAGEQRPRALQCHDRVLERRGGALPGDLLHLGEVLPHPLRERRAEVGVSEHVERRRLIRKGAGLEQWVRARRRGGRGVGVARSARRLGGGRVGAGLEGMGHGGAGGRRVSGPKNTGATTSPRVHCLRVRRRAFLPVGAVAPSPALPVSCGSPGDAGDRGRSQERIMSERPPPDDDPIVRRFPGVYSLPSRGGAGAGPPTPGRPLALLAGGVLLFFLLSAALPFATRRITDWLWYRELGFERVFLTKIAAQWAIGLAAGAVAFAALYASARTALRGVDVGTESLALQLDRAARFPGAITTLRARLAATLALPGTIVLALLVGVTAAAQWRTALQFAYRTPFGVRDPVFGRDVGYYVFLTAGDRAAGGFALLSLLAVRSHHLARGDVARGPRWSSAPRAQGTSRARRSCCCSRRSATRRRAGALRRAHPAPGANYVDLTPGCRRSTCSAPRVLGGPQSCGAAARAAGAGWRSSRWRPIRLSRVAAVRRRGFQRLIVQANELARESPQIVHHIRATREAWGIDRVEQRELGVDGRAHAAVIAANRSTIDNVRLWDREPLLQTFGQIQAIRTYYDFVAVDDDRYRIGGQLRQVMLSAREMNTARCRRAASSTST
jgi:hypothetical protein